MCQLCAIKNLAAKDRWPKPLEEQKKDLNFLVDLAHEEVQAYEKQKQTAPTSPPSATLCDRLKLLYDQVNALEVDREKWWTSKEKHDQRRILELEGQRQKLSNLHKINNTATAAIEAMSAKLGSFVKWGLGVNGGIWELIHADKVVQG